RRCVLCLSENMVLGLGYNVAVKRQEPSNTSFWSEDICVIYPDLPRQKTLLEVPRFSERLNTLSPSVGYPLIDGIVPAVEWSLPDGRPAAPTYPAKLDEVACPACGLARQIGRGSMTVTGAVGIADAYSHCRNLAADQNDVKHVPEYANPSGGLLRTPIEPLGAAEGYRNRREVIPGSNASKTPDLNLLPIDEDSTTEPVYSSQAGGARLRIEPATSEIKEIIPGSNAFRVPDLNFLPMAQDLTAEPVCSSQAGGTAFTSEKEQAVQELAISVEKLDPGRQLLSNVITRKRKMDHGLVSKPRKTKLSSGVAKLQEALARDPEDRLDQGYKRKIGTFHSNSIGMIREDQNLEKNIESAKNLDHNQLQSDRTLLEQFDFYNWDYVREDTEDRISADTQYASSEYKRKSFFKLLQSCKKTRTPDKFFWIPRKQAFIIMKRFRQSKHDYAFPKNVAKSRRIKALYQITLSLSNKRIGIERYSVYSNEIVNPWTSKLEVNLKAAKKERLERSIEVIKDVTKITPFLVVTYLLLFKEHRQHKLTADFIEELLTFIKDLWINIEKGSPEFLEENPWAKRLRNMLIMEIDPQENDNHNFIYELDIAYEISWNLTRYWIEINGKSLKHGFGKKKDLHKDLAELINKIIFYSNYQRMCYLMKDAS
ncbi:hypothetical protein PSHT_07674, partial [Puccinia striiformis]